MTVSPVRVNCLDKNLNSTLSDVVKVVNLQGKLKSSKRQSSELHFDFTISYIGEHQTMIILYFHPIYIPQFAWLILCWRSIARECRGAASKTMK